MATKQQAVYTHGHHESVLRAHRVRTAENSAGYLLPHLRPGMSVLDVGCGPGTITVDLAARIAPGQLTAVEQTDSALDLARAEVQARDQSNVEFLTADVHALDLPDDSFDVVHAHQVLQHVADPVQALREMRRVCKPGGVVAARDADYDGFVWFPQSQALDRWMTLYATAARANGGEPDAGRRLLWWAQQAGFDDITPTGSLCASRPRRPASGGVGCGPTGSSNRLWRGNWSNRAWRPTPNSGRSRQPGGAGLTPPTAGFPFRTARFCAASNSFMLVRHAVLAFSFSASTLFKIDNDTLEEPCVSE